MSCGPTHYAGCACHEARWAERLAATEALSERYRLALWEIKVSDLTADDCYKIARAALNPPPEAEKKGGEE